MDSFKAPLPPKPKLAPVAPVVNPLKEEGTGPSWSGQGHGLMLPPPVKAKAPPAPDVAATPSPDAAPPASAPEPGMPKVDLKYQVPIWSPKKAVHPWKVEVLKSGQVIGDQEINSKGFFLVGRLPICDVELEHPTISRQHAIIQHRSNGNLYVYDLGSTHGTFVNKNRIKPSVYVQLKNNYQLRFGESTRVFVIQGGPEEQEPVPEQLSAAEQAHQAALQQLKSGGGEEDDEEDTQKEEIPDGQDVFTGNLSEFKQFMKKQRGKAQTKNKKPKKDAKKLLAQLPELSKRVHGMVDDSDSDEDEEAAAPEAAEELPEDLELATRVTAAEEMYDSGDENDDFYDRTTSKGAKTEKKAESESESSDDEEENELNPEIAAAKRRKKLLKKHKKEKAAAAKAQTVETLEKRVQDIETQKENLLFAIDELKTQANQAAQEEDSLDSFMKGVSATLHSDKITKLQKQMEVLNRQQEEARQLINLARPALERVPAKPTATSADAKPFAVPAAPKHRPATTTSATSAPTPVATQLTAAPAALAPPAAKPAKASRGGSLTNYIGLFETAHGEADNKRPADDGAEVHSIDPTELEKGGADAAAPPDKKKAKKDNDEPEAEAFQEWAPPTNQSGDGRTYLNDLYGY